MTKNAVRPSTRLHRTGTVARVWFITTGGTFAAYQWFMQQHSQAWLGATVGTVCPILRPAHLALTTALTAKYQMAYNMGLGFSSRCAVPSVLIRVLLGTCSPPPPSAI